MPRPEDIPQAFADAWNDNDAAAIGDLFAEDAEFVNVVGLWWHDRERIQRAHSIAFESYFADAEASVSRQRVRCLTDDVAVVHWKWRMSGQVSPDGEAADDRSGIFVMVVQRLDDEWKVVTAQNTDIIPQSESLVASGRQRDGAWYGD
jgi:uncharacterized protein (TIGR02246 family)